MYKNFLRRSRVRSQKLNVLWSLYMYSTILLQIPQTIINLNSTSNYNFIWDTLTKDHCYLWVDWDVNPSLVSTYVVCERLSVMHKQVSVHIPQTVNFCSNSPESPFLKFQTRKFTPKYPPPPFQKTSGLKWPKFTPKYPPPPSENFRFEMTKAVWNDQSCLKCPKFTPEYPPPIVVLQSGRSYVETNL